MRLIRCHIENFGNLHDLTVEFARDFHLISEPNGWGKSTLAAFLRVMFFGFEGESKRKGLENERKRFEPWQGGVYGGQVTFEAGGRTYTAARIFAGKKADDAFELRDEETNLKSDDFSENLGEDIFRINGESFARTVFLGQNDCATAATDSINAKIGNLTDNMNDLDSYEKANAALTEVKNKLTPRRSTGLLSRMNDEITRMQTEVTQNASLGETIREYTARQNETRERLQENRRQQEKLYQISGQVSAAQERSAKRGEYRRLCAECEQTEETYRQAASRFPGEVPSAEKLRECMEACDDMERSAEGMRIYALTDSERDQLGELSGDSREMPGDTESVAGEEPRDEARETAPDGTSPREIKSSKRGLILLICGILLAGAALAVFFAGNRFWPWLAVAAAGAALLVIGLVLRRRDARRAAEAQEEQRQRQEEQRQRQEESQRKLEEAQRAAAREREARREMLAEKQHNYLDSRDRYEERHSWVREQIRRMGLSPEDPLNTQIREIWEWQRDWQNARKDAAAAGQRKREFEEENDMSSLSAEDEASLEKLPSQEELHDLQGRLGDEAEEIRAQADAYEAQLAVLREKYDEWTETSERLAEEKEERAERKKQYDQVCLAMDCLADAKEAMTAKYMEPLMTSFSEYYRILTGESAQRYRMDANTNLTVEEGGLQRETIWLSRGWQDLIGLCLRLALVDAMYPEEKPFLILDDPLVNLDTEKLEGGKRLMEAVSQRCQVIYFTCRGVDYGFAD